MDMKTIKTNYVEIYDYLINSGVSAHSITEDVLIRSSEILGIPIKGYPLIHMASGMRGTGKTYLNEQAIERANRNNQRKKTLIIDVMDFDFTGIKIQRGKQRY